MSRKNGLSPYEILAVLRELSDKESEGGELHENEEEIEEIIIRNNSLLDSGKNEDALNTASDKDGIYLSPDTTKWKMCVNMKVLKDSRSKMSCFTPLSQLFMPGIS